MMSANLKSMAMGLTLLSFLLSCNDDDPAPDANGAYDHGVFILNEGNFSDSDGSLSYFDLDSLVVQHGVFETVNDRPFAGVFQSMRFYGGHGYLIDQLGRVEVVQAEDLVSTHSVSAGLDIPRYFAGYRDEGFITDWGPYDGNFMNNESKVLVYDLDGMILANEIETASRPEDIVIIKDKIYVANSATDIVSIYDVNSKLLIEELEVSMGPSRFAVDKNENLLVICTGAYITTGALNWIDTGGDSLIFNLDLADFPPGGPLAINGGGDMVYFLSQTYNPDFSTENTVYMVELIYHQLEPVRAELPVPVVSGTNWYGLGIDPQTDVIYVADAAGFLSNGSVLRYDGGGNLIDRFDAGRGPRDFVFRYE